MPGSPDAARDRQNPEETRSPRHNRSHRRASPEQRCIHRRLHLLVLHTTAALTTADLDPGTDLDMLDAFEAMVPKLRIAIRTIRRTSEIT